MDARKISASFAGSLSLGGELSVHRLGFGAMRLTGEAIWGAPKNRAEAIAVLRRAMELDVNFMDTPDSYGPNISEELIAEALFPYPSGLVIATKGGNRPGPNQWTHDATPVDYCQRNGIAFIPWFPLAAGRVAGQALDQMARARQATPHQVAIAWLSKRSPVMLPIPGTSSVRHLEENVRAASLQLIDEEFQNLSRVPQLAATR